MSTKLENGDEQCSTGNGDDIASPVIDSENVGASDNENEAHEDQSYQTHDDEANENEFNEANEDESNQTNEDESNITVDDESNQTVEDESKQTNDKSDSNKEDHEDHDKNDSANMNENDEIDSSVVDELDEKEDASETKEDDSSETKDDGKYKKPVFSEIISEDEYQFEFLRARKRRQIHIGPFSLPDLANEVLFRHMNNSESFNLHFTKKESGLEGFIEITMFTEEEAVQSIEEFKDCKNGIEVYCKGKADIGNIRSRFQQMKASTSKHHWAFEAPDDIIIKGCYCDSFKVAENCVVVRQVPEDVTEKDIMEKISGAIGVIIPKSQISKIIQRYAYVELDTSEEAKALDRTEIIINDVTCYLNGLDKIPSLKELFEFFNAKWIKAANEKNLSLTQEQKSKMEVFVPYANHYVDYSLQVSEEDKTRLEKLRQDAIAAYKITAKGINQPSKPVRTKRGMNRNLNQRYPTGVFPRDTYQAAKRPYNDQRSFGNGMNKVPRLSDVRPTHYPRPMSNNLMNRNVSSNYGYNYVERNSQSNGFSFGERNSQSNGFSFGDRNNHSNQRNAAYDSNLFDEKPNRSVQNGYDFLRGQSSSGRGFGGRSNNQKGTQWTSF